jgi:hypothetical protein
MVHEWEQLSFSAGYRLHRFSVKEYRRMTELGLVNAELTELLDGVVLDTAARPDRTHVVRLGAILGARTRELVQLGPYSLVRFDAFVAGDDDRGGMASIGASMRLAIDVSDDIEMVRQVRWPVYARWGVQEAWLADVQTATLHAARGLSAGCYITVQIHREGDTVRVPASTDTLAVETLLHSVHRP